MMVLVRARSPLPVTLSVEEGTRFPLVYTVSGRLLLAFAEANLREEYWPATRSIWKLSQRARRAFRRRSCRRFARRGHHVARSDITECVTDVGVPVGLAGSDLFAALTLPCINDPIGRVRSRPCCWKPRWPAHSEINDAIGLIRPVNVVNGAVGALAMNGRASDNEGVHHKQSRVARAPAATARGG